MVCSEQYANVDKVKVIGYAALCNSLLAVNLVGPTYAKDCSYGSRMDKQLCEASGEVIIKPSIDNSSGLEVVEIKTDIDWKSANKANVPWSKIVKIK